MRYLIIMLVLFIATVGYSQKMDTTLFNGFLSPFISSTTGVDSVFSFQGIFVNSGNQFSFDDIDDNTPEKYYLAVEASGVAYELQVLTINSSSSIVTGTCVDKTGTLLSLPAGAAYIYSKTVNRKFPASISGINPVLDNYIENQFRWQVDTIKVSPDLNITTWSSNDTLFFDIEGDTSIVVVSSAPTDDQVLSFDLSNPETLLLSIENGNVLEIPTDVFLDNVDTSGFISNIFINNDTLFIEESYSDTSYIPLVLGDGDTTNEIQYLSLINDTLFLSKSDSVVSLAGYLDNTDNQNLSASPLINANRIDISLTGSDTGFSLKEGNNIILGKSGDSIIISAKVETIIDEIYSIGDTLFIIAGSDTASSVVATGYNESFTLANDTLSITDAGGTLSVPMSDVNLFSDDLTLTENRVHEFNPSTSFTFDGGDNNSFIVDSFDYVRIGKETKGLTIYQYSSNTSDYLKFEADDQGENTAADKPLVYFNLNSQSSILNALGDWQTYSNSPLPFNFVPSRMLIDANIGTAGKMFKIYNDLLIINSKKIVFRPDLLDPTKKYPIDTTVTHLLARKDSVDKAGELVEIPIQKIIQDATQELAVDTITADSFTLSITGGNSISIPRNNTFKTVNYYTGENDEAFVMASDTGVVLEIDPSSGAKTVYVPKGVQLFRFQIEGTSSDLSNQSYFITFGFNINDGYNATTASRLYPDVRLYKNNATCNDCYVDLNVSYGVVSFNLLGQNRLMNMEIGNGELNSVSYPEYLIVFDFL